MANIKITALTELTIAADTAIVPVVDIAGGTVTKKITAANLKSYMVDYPPTNQFYIDPKRTDTYTATGNPNKPFKTISSCYTYIKSLITAGTISSAETNPVFMILCGSITENITLDTGHIFLIGNNSGIHAPIYITGNITINGTASGAGAIDANHFSLSGLAISGTAQSAAIRSTGSNPQRVFMKDLWLFASGNQTGTTPFTNAGGYGFYQDNTGSGTITSGDQIKISHTGTGDVYCIDIINGSASFSEVETSGATQVGAVQNGATLTFTTSELDANGEVCLESYGTGRLVVSDSIISNARTGVDSHGIWLHAAGGAALITNTIIDVASSTSGSRMIKGVAGTGVFYKNIMIGKATTFPFADHNKTIDAAVTSTLITTDTFTTV